jgi:hypothetical protein
VRIARMLQRRADDPEALRRMSEHCAACLAVPLPPAQRVLINAVERAIRRRLK